MFRFHYPESAGRDEHRVDLKLPLRQGATARKTVVISNFEITTMRRQSLDLVAYAEF